MPSEQFTLPAHGGAFPADGTRLFSHTPPTYTLTFPLLQPMDFQSVVIGVFTAVIFIYSAVIVADQPLVSVAH